MKDFAGIYKITNKVNGKVYIGQSVKVRGRITCHRSMLRHKRHTNKHLQSSYDAHGANCFTFQVVIKCEVDDLTLFEQAFIDRHKSLNPKYGYNLTDAAPGGKHRDDVKRRIGEANKRYFANSENRKARGESLKGRVFTDETKRRMSAGQYRRVARDGPCVHSEETKRKISDGLKRYTEKRKAKSS